MDVHKYADLPGGRPSRRCRVEFAPVDWGQLTGQSAPECANLLQEAGVTSFFASRRRLRCWAGAMPMNKGTQMRKKRRERYLQQKTVLAEKRKARTVARKEALKKAIDDHANGEPLSDEAAVLLAVHQASVEEREAKCRARKMAAKQRYHADPEPKRAAERERHQKKSESQCGSSAQLGTADSLEIDGAAIVAGVKFDPETLSSGKFMLTTEKKRAYARDRYRANAASIKAAARAKYQRNKEELQAAARDRYQQNKETIRASARARYREKREPILALRRAKYGANPEPVRAYQRARYYERYVKGKPHKGNRDPDRGSTSTKPPQRKNPKPRRIVEETRDAIVATPTHNPSVQSPPLDAGCLSQPPLFARLTCQLHSPPCPDDTVPNSCLSLEHRQSYKWERLVGSRQADIIAKRTVVVSGESVHARARRPRKPNPKYTGSDAFDPSQDSCSPGPSSVPRPPYEAGVVHVGSYIAKRTHA